MFFKFLLLLYSVVAYHTINVGNILENKEYVVSDKSIDRGNDMYHSNGTSINVNNDIDANKLIKSLYKDEDLQSFYSIKETNINLECVRVLNDYIYTVHKSKDGKFLFTLFEKSDPSRNIDRWYCKEGHTLQEFRENIKKGTPIENVQKFEPYGEYGGLYVSCSNLKSKHHTLDGYKIYIEYVGTDNNTAVVSNIEELGGEDNPIYFYMLDIDKKLIHKDND